MELQFIDIYVYTGVHMFAPHHHLPTERKVAETHNGGTALMRDQICNW